MTKYIKSLILENNILKSKHINLILSMIVGTILNCSCNQNPISKNNVSEENLWQLNEKQITDTNKKDLSYIPQNGYFQNFGQITEKTWSEKYNEAYKTYSINDMPYRLMPPINFDVNKKYPVVVTLHGGGGLTTEFSMLTFFNYILYNEDNRRNYPAYILAPGSKAGWNETHLNNVKDIISKLPSVDMNRIYIYGHSLGGNGAFYFIWNDTNYFAAAVTSAPKIYADREEMKAFVLKIKEIPIWAFQGGKDTICPYDIAEMAFEEMKNIGANVKFSTLVGVGHRDIEKEMMMGSDNLTTQFSSHKCDNEPDLIKWFFSQKKQ